jgi:hypothetical protein
MSKSVKIIFFFLLLSFVRFNSMAQEPHKLDSLKLYHFDKKLYKISLNEFDKLYGFNDTAKYIIDIYRFGRKIGWRNSIISLPAGAALFAGADYAITRYVFTKDEDRQFSTFMVVCVPIVFGSIVYFARGLLHLKIYTKKHLLEDLVLYRQKHEFRSRVYQYMEDVYFDDTKTYESEKLKK